MPSRSNQSQVCLISAAEADTQSGNMQREEMMKRLREKNTIQVRCVSYIALKKKRLKRREKAGALL